MHFSYEIDDSAVTDSTERLFPEGVPGHACGCTETIASETSGWTRLIDLSPAPYSICLSERDRHGLARFSAFMHMYETPTLEVQHNHHIPPVVSHVQAIKPGINKDLRLLAKAD